MSPFYKRREEATLVAPMRTPVKIKKGDLFRVLEADYKELEIKLVGIDDDCLGPHEEHLRKKRGKKPEYIDPIVRKLKKEAINRVRKMKMRELRKSRKEKFSPPGGTND